LKQQNYYELLNLSRVHDASDLKQAFKKQAVLHHPDKKKDDPNADLYFN
jgi:DnaJ-class molecular chaperone